MTMINKCKLDSTFKISCISGSSSSSSSSSNSKTITSLLYGDICDAFLSLVGN